LTRALARGCQNAPRERCCSQNAQNAPLLPRMAKLDLLEHADKRTAALSGGNRRKLCAGIA
jgi:ABC-type phosphate/phosphonate transport system ATPase subunit